MSPTLQADSLLSEPPGKPSPFKTVINSERVLDCALACLAGVEKS